MTYVLVHTALCLKNTIIFLGPLETINQTCLRQWMTMFGINVTLELCSGIHVGGKHEMSVACMCIIVLNFHYLISIAIVKKYVINLLCSLVQ